MQYFDNIIAN